LPAGTFEINDNGKRVSQLESSRAGESKQRL